MATVKGDTPAVAPKPHYTCLIRLPFPRGDFVDPAPVDWDGTKDAALWKLISKAANSKDLDWPELSHRFQVSLPFLLQQAAWLYERHFAQMRAQMKKLGTSNTSSPAPQQESGVGSVPLHPGQQRPGTAERFDHVHVSAKWYLYLSYVSSMAKVGVAPPMSRTPSTRTVTQSRLTTPASPREAQPSRSFRSSFGSHRKPTVLENIHAEDSSSPPNVSSTSTISSSSSDAPVHQSVAKSQVFRRPPDLRTISSDGDAEDDDDDDDSSAGFLPFASRAEDAPVAAPEGNALARTTSREASDPAATLRTASGGRIKDKTPQMRQDVFSSTSSADSPPQVKRAPLASSQSTTTAPTQASHRAAGGLLHGAGPSRMARTQSVPGPSSRPPVAAGDRRSIGQASGPGALSPRHRAEIGRLSGRTSKEGSEGTPSMGSSFSDLDDASVTQSALEDALLSNMQHGNIASRMSNFSQALRSKYLPQ
ncbi:Autophagy-related protein 29 [Sphaceloma murrayae]|uniref:Autophagy-related protein 29 n=1 Tax=Sphaceloma murrayae TaxID=2082308 RepID=A0A2K1QLF5_9PEZI|nr:Autophagy-related protein 29 [Sphaceloma murrayae]